MKINPFDQPAVELIKKHTKKFYFPKKILISQITLSKILSFFVISI